MNKITKEEYKSLLESMNVITQKTLDKYESENKLKVSEVKELNCSTENSNIIKRIPFDIDKFRKKMASYKYD